MKNVKEYFAEFFTLLAWLTLLAFVFYCTITGNKTDSVRDAWNILILIAGFVWGKGHERKLNAGNSTAEISATITTNPNAEENEK